MKHAISLLLLCTTCAAHPTILRREPGATCETTCAHWEALGCEEAKPSPAGVSCPDVCAPYAGLWDLECMAAVDRCDQIDLCTGVE